MCEISGIMALFTPVLVLMGRPSKELSESYLLICKCAPKLKIFSWIWWRKPSRIANETIMMARPMAMLIIAIFVTEEVNDSDAEAVIFFDMYRETFTRLNFLQDNHQFRFLSFRTMFQPLAILISFFLFSLPSCQRNVPNGEKTVAVPAEKPAQNAMVSGQKSAENATKTTIKPGAEQTELYLKLLRGKRIALVVNQTSVIGKTHLVDSLLAHKINIVKIFAPEHGFRGEADAGAHVKNETDTKTGLPLVSLYGKNKKPTPEQIADVDIILFDIQDVGIRFYTYISTLHYVMEAAAENNKTVLVLDRPNPNGDYVDGPVLQMENTSFVGMHPIPLVHGLTVAELAKMLNGEKWLAGGKQCKLEVVPVKNYDHKTPYNLPIRPSPNLPNDQSIRLYPSLGLFEGTNVSVGRGTDKPFQQIGSPFYKDSTYSFIPRSLPGATNPPHLNVKCFGLDLTKTAAPKFTLKYLIDFYKNSKQQDKFFNSFLTKLAGTTELRKQIEAGMTEDAIRKTWQPELKRYKETRKKYLLYPDFE